MKIIHNTIIKTINAVHIITLLKIKSYSEKSVMILPLNARTLKF